VLIGIDPSVLLRGEPAVVKTGNDSCSGYSHYGGVKVSGWREKLNGFRYFIASSPPRGLLEELLLEPEMKFQQFQSIGKFFIPRIQIFIA